MARVGKITKLKAYLEMEKDVVDGGMRVASEAEDYETASIWKKHADTIQNSLNIINSPK